MRVSIGSLEEEREFQTEETRGTVGAGWELERVVGGGRVKLEGSSL